MTRRMIVLLALVTMTCSGFARAAAAPAEPATRPVAQVQRVLIISIDGLRPDLLLRARTPHIRDLFENGAYTFWARTTAASITLPSHVSMLTGVVPEVHAIHWNADLPLEQRVYPNAPTLFELAKRAGYTTALVAGKSKFNIMAKPGTIDWGYYPSSPTCEDAEVVAQAERILREHKPGVMVVHLPSVDNVGHAKGWGAAEQIGAVEQSDDCVGQLVRALEELGLRDGTMILITADHGGAGRTHGPEDPRSRTIPWIVNGPGIRKGFDLTRVPDLEVETYDTFTTTCHMLGIAIERRVRGKFIAPILEQQELLQPPAGGHPQPLTAPTSQPAGS